MGHDHGHSHASAATAGARHRRPLLIAFVLPASYMLVELIVGLATGSLALLSDAAHMGTDVLSLGMALAAITLAQASAHPQRTFGTYRLEVLAALANGVLLFGVAGYVIYEAVQRFADPPEVPGLPMLAVR
ncbi:cation efflux system protein [Nocardioides sp. PD653]|nr:cation efflux system protein [Nocardioides sp. PD653-B2]GAW56501.1 cation efflux system protein [Nocardioides sp. PD653]